MATIESRDTARKGRVYDLRYREAGKERTETFAGEEALRRAKLRKLEVEGASLRGVQALPRDVGRVTLREYVEGHWLPHQHRHKSPATRQNVRGTLDRWVYRPVGGRSLGDRPLGSIEREHVQEWVTFLSARLAPKTIAVHYTWLATIFKSAVADRKIDRTPCVRIVKPALKVVKVRPLRADQVSALASAIRPRYRAMVLLGATTGLRYGEMAGLSVADVDLDEGVVTVSQQWGKVDKALRPPKTSGSCRPVPIDARTVAMLCDHLAQYGRGSFVFSTHFGNPVTHNRFGEIWGEARTKVGLPKVRFHDLRHFYASLLIRANLDPKMVQERLGHESIKTTYDLYGHLWEDADDRTRAATATFADLI